MATKKTARKSTRSTKGRAKVREVMREYKQGELKSGGRKKVKNRKQAIAIALSEARQSGADIPDRRSPAKKRAAAKKTASKKVAGKKSAAKKSAARKTSAKKTGAKKTRVKSRR
jgi:hypothetical protein